MPRFDGLTCEGCNFFETKDVVFMSRKIVGICRLHAPIVLSSERDEVRTEWPQTMGEDWCGEGIPNSPTIKMTPSTIHIEGPARPEDLARVMEQWLSSRRGDT